MAEEKEERKLYRGFTVTPGICGFSVHMGCSTLFFGSANELAPAIVDYLGDPLTTEKKFLGNDQRLKNGQPEVAPPTAPGYADQPMAGAYLGLNQALNPGNAPSGAYLIRPRTLDESKTV